MLDQMQAEVAHHGVAADERCPGAEHAEGKLADESDRNETGQRQEIGEVIRCVAEQKHECQINGGKRYRGAEHLGHLEEDSPAHLGGIAPFGHAQHFGDDHRASPDRTGTAWPGAWVVAPSTVS